MLLEVCKAPGTEGVKKLGSYNYRHEEKIERIVYKLMKKKVLE